MTPEQRRFVGIILFVIGLVTLAAGGGVVALTASARAEAAQKFTEAQTSCKQRLEGLGGNVQEAPNRLIWIKENLAEGPARLGEASVAGVLCPGWRLVSACIGQECPEPNAMRMVLAPIHEPTDE